MCLIIFSFQRKMFKFIPTMTTGVVQTFGKFSKLLNPGFNIYIPFIQTVHLVSNRLQQNQCSLQIRTADKVFPTLDITIQYKIRAQDTASAYFQLSDPVNQMVSYTDNCVRRVASSLTLDQLFQSQSHIADAIIQDVGQKMSKAGFTIESAQVRNITPPKQIINSMNEINASERRRIAAKNDGEAVKIKAVLMAQADAKQKALRGQGIALMRQNIIKGWTQSVLQMSGKTGIHSKDVIQFMLKVLQQQTMQTMSKQAGTKVIFTDKSIQTQGQANLKRQIMEAFQAQYKAKNQEHQ